MARYDLYVWNNGYLVDVQADTLEGLNTRVVIPVLSPRIAPRPANRLNPTLEIGGNTFVMVTQFVSAVEARSLGRPVGNLAEKHDEIVAALDFLFQGF